MSMARIIVKLDIKGENVVKGIHLEGIRQVGAPEQLAEKYYKDKADEIIYLDVVASLYGRNNLKELVERVSNNIFIPLTVGGGIRSLDDIHTLLRAGADKVAVNTWLIEHPEFVSQAVKHFGSQCIVGSVHARRTGKDHWEALYNYGRDVSGKDAVNWAVELVRLGVGELLITSIDQDGTLEGYDCRLIEKISTRVKVPVIASGGAGSLAHVRDVICKGYADAVCLSSALHYNHLSISQIKNFLKKTQ